MGQGANGASRAGCVSRKSFGSCSFNGARRHEPDSYWLLTFGHWPVAEPVGVTNQQPTAGAQGTMGQPFFACCPVKAHEPKFLMDHPASTQATISLAGGPITRASRFIESDIANVRVIWWHGHLACAVRPTKPVGKAGWEARLGWSAVGKRHVRQSESPGACGGAVRRSHPSKPGDASAIELGSSASAVTMKRPGPTKLAAGEDIAHS